jgi:hypothetical protein
MKQPKTIRVINESERALYGLPKKPIECSLLEYDGETQVVYISNPKYKKDAKIEPPYITSAPLIALTKYDYEVVKWY